MSLAKGRGYSGRNKDMNKKPGQSDSDDSSKQVSLDAPIPKGTVMSDNPSAQRLSDSECVKQCLSPEDEASLNELLYIDDAHIPFILMLESFKPGEDGIAFNNRLREFENLLMTTCTDELQLAAAFASIGACALSHAAAARQLALTGAALSRLPSNNVTPLRTALLNLMQAIFMRIDLLERCSPDILINAVNLMGDYFSEARLSTGGRVSVLSRPLVRYLIALLKIGGMKAHRTMTTQLMLNGRELLTHTRSEIDELNVAIKQEILRQPTTLTWLLLSADLCLNKFLPLPDSLQQFYAKHLDLVPEVEENYTEVAYGSWRSSPDRSEEVLNTSLDEPRKPRPILGMGARNQSSTDTLNTSQEYNNPHQDDYQNYKRAPMEEFVPFTINSEVQEGGRCRQVNQEVSANQGVSANHDVSAGDDSFEQGYQKSTLSKRYDLNSWRQQQGPGGDVEDNSQNISRIIESAVDCKPFIPQDKTPEIANWRDRPNADDGPFDVDKLRDRLSAFAKSSVRPIDGERLSVRPNDGERSSVRPIDVERSSVRPIDSQTSSVRPIDDERPSVRPLEGERPSYDLDRSMVWLSEADKERIWKSDREKHKVLGERQRERRSSTDAERRYSGDKRRTDGEGRRFHMEKNDKRRSEGESAIRTNDGDQTQGRNRNRSEGEVKDGRSDSHGRGPRRVQPANVPRSAKYWGHDDRCDRDYD